MFDIERFERERSRAVVTELEKKSNLDSQHLKCFGGVKYEECDGDCFEVQHKYTLGLLNCKAGTAL